MEIEQKISGAFRQKRGEKTSGSESQAVYRDLLNLEKQEKLKIVSLEALIRAGK